MIKPDPKIVDEINSLSHLEMARLWRFAPPGHPYFDGSLPYSEIFMKRYNDFGGMNPSISKELGWADGKINED